MPVFFSLRTRERRVEPFFILYLVREKDALFQNANIRNLKQVWPDEMCVASLRHFLSQVLNVTQQFLSRQPCQGELFRLYLLLCPVI